MAFSFEREEHTADAAFRIHADSREDLVIGCFAALRSILGLQTNETVDPGFSTTLTFESRAVAENLVDLLNEWLFYIRDRGYRPGKESVVWNGNCIACTLENISIVSSELHTEIKAVTYHQASIENRDGKLSAFWIADL